MSLVTIPTVHNIDRIIAEARSGSGCQRGLADGRWVAARPVSWQASGPYAWWLRAKVAYRVFTGRYDALEWTGQ